MENTQLEVKETGGKKGVARFGRAQFDFTPNSMQEALDLAKVLADSDLVPIAYKNKPGNVLVAMNYGAELGLSGIQAVQNLAVINGKPCIYGDLGKALLLRHGCSIDDFDTPQVQKENKAWCKVTRPDGRSMERTFTVEDAKKAGLWGKPGPWSTYPYRQMQWRAFWFVARDLCADLLKGLNGAEEVQDYEVKLVKPAIAMPKLKAPEPKQLTEQYSREAVEVREDKPTQSSEVIQIEPENLAVSAQTFESLPDTKTENIEVKFLDLGIRAYTSKGVFSANLTLPNDRVLKVKNVELAKTIKAAIEQGKDGVLSVSENEVTGVAVL